MEIRDLLKRSGVLRKEISAMTKKLELLNTELQEIDAQLNQRLDLKGREIEDLSEDEFLLLMSEIENTSKMNIEVVYITNENQVIREVQLGSGSTINDAIDMSGILDEVKEINLEENKVGIFGFIKPLSHVLYDGDRVEIYRPVSAK